MLESPDGLQPSGLVTAPWRLYSLHGCELTLSGALAASRWSRRRPLSHSGLLFEAQTPGMQQRLSVAGRLLAALEHQITGGAEGMGLLEVRCHRAVGRIAGILPVDHLSHALQRLAHLSLADHAVVQPVGDVLGRD